MPFWHDASAPSWTCHADKASTRHVTNRWCLAHMHCDARTCKTVRWPMHTWWILASEWKRPSRCLSYHCLRCTAESTLLVAVVYGTATCRCSGRQCCATWQQMKACAQASSVSLVPLRLMAAMDDSGRDDMILKVAGLIMRHTGGRRLRRASHTQTQTGRRRACHALAAGARASDQPSCCMARCVLCLPSASMRGSVRLCAVTMARRCDSHSCRFSRATA